MTCVSRPSSPSRAEGVQATKLHVWPGSMTDLTRQSEYHLFTQHSEILGPGCLHKRSCFSYLSRDPLDLFVARACIPSPKDPRAPGWRISVGIGAVGCTSRCDLKPGSWDFLASPEL